MPRLAPTLVVTRPPRRADLELTFHRAFDLVRDQRQALNDLVACRVKRVLSSGGAQSVMEGLLQLAELVGEGGSRISVMPGGGLTEENALTVARVTGCSEVHGTFKASVPSAMAYRHAGVSFGADDWSRQVTSAAVVQRVKAQLGALEGGRGDGGARPMQQRLEAPTRWGANAIPSAMLIQNSSI